MQRRIYISDTENPAVHFDTGLEPRSFARTKMSQSLIEHGYIVSSDGTYRIWKSAGVNEIDGFMRVWGPLFTGKRLDILLDEIDLDVNNIQKKQEALQAVVLWIKAKLYLGEIRSSLNPGASFVSDENIFFAPEHLSTRCLYIEQTSEGALQQDRYNCPDLTGIDAAAFCAGAMLYKILSGSRPYPAAETYQKMREGLFIPMYFAAPELNKKMSELIQDALNLPINKKNIIKNGAEILTEMLDILCLKKQTVNISSLYITLSEERKSKIIKEKKWYLFRSNIKRTITNTVIRNKNIFIGSGVVLLLFLFIIFNAIRPDPNRRKTEGLTSDAVVIAYYNAFSSLDHIFMEACLMGADISDINTAASLFAISRVRQAYENSANPIITPALTWRDHGGSLPAPNVFGVTDLKIDHINGNENDTVVTYNVEYLLWAPEEEAINRSDTLTLKRDKHNNWRITDILRVEQ